MGLVRIYLRVVALLGPEKWLATALALANAALAAAFLIEPSGPTEGLRVVELAWR